jgi:hypothetical protein
MAEIRYGFYMGKIELSFAVSKSINLNMIFSINE